MPSRKIRTTIALLAATLTVATLGVSAAPAGAATGRMTADLKVTPLSPGAHWVIVWGRVEMSQVEAQRLLDSGHRFVVRLWGEDPVSDDLLLGPYDRSGAFDGSVGADWAGLYFGYYMKVSDRILDEDVGEDDLYAGVRLVNSRGETVRALETNRVWGRF